MLHAPQPSDRAAAGRSPTRTSFGPRTPRTATEWLDSLRCVVPGSSAHVRLLQLFVRLPPAEQETVLNALQPTTPSLNLSASDALAAQLHWEQNQKSIDASGLIDTSAGHRTRRMLRESRIMASGPLAAGTLMTTGDVALAEFIGQLASMGTHRVTRPGTYRTAGPLARANQEESKPLTLKLGFYAPSAAAATRRPRRQPIFEEKPQRPRERDRLRESSLATQRQVLREASTRDGILEVPGKTDRAVLLRAREDYLDYEKSRAAMRERGGQIPPADRYMEHLLTNATQEVMAQKLGKARAEAEVRAGPIGFVDGCIVLGSGRTGVGIVRLEGTWYVGQMANQQNPRRASLAKIYGRLL